ESVGLPETPGARVQRIERELRCNEHRVHPGLGDLPRHLLTLADVPLEPHQIAMQVDDEHDRPVRIEFLRDEKAHVAIRIGSVLPINAAARRGVTAAVAGYDIKKWLADLRDY